jgi:1-deoxy-D-xylulose-5-phosphate reductoisomerase
VAGLTGSGHGMKMTGIVILGSTGSIGRQTLDVVRALPDRFRVVGLAAGRNLDLLAQQVREFRPELVWAEHAEAASAGLTTHGASFVPMDEMVVHPDVDLTMVATTGRAGLGPTLRALRQGKAVALANKEVIIMAGEMVAATALQYGAPLLPVDSEPSAIWQCLRGEEQPVARLIITASGGPFRQRPLEDLPKVTPQEALAHPTWSMGQKITIDSSTLMNKGFEVIECHWLFDMPFDKIDVVVHPQSVVHSMVELADGSVKAQLGPPDMRLPIQYAMLYPERVPNETLPKYDPLRYPSLTFEPLDVERYPCFKTAVEAGIAGRTYPAVLSAADEEAVQLFLQQRIGYSDIHRLVCDALDVHQPSGDGSLDAVLEADAWARRRVAQLTNGT